MLRPVKTRAANAHSPIVARRTFPFWALIQLVLATVLALLVAFVFFPIGMWIYHVERGGRLINQALIWPEPRYADTTPALHNSAAATEALNHLQAAASWRPRATQPYRLMAQIYAAQEDWASANEALDTAHRYQPTDPLIAWEQALVVERVLAIAERAPSESILPDLLSVPIQAPATPIRTIYCEPGRPETCYVAFERFTQAFADDPAGVPVQLDSLFMYPPAAVALKRPVSAGNPVLAFALGLDPNMRGGKSDGATFEIWLTSADGSRQRVYSRTINRTEAQQGWTRDRVDLSAWSGQEITLELRTTGGPAGDTVDDWYAWGDPVMTTAEAARNNRRGVEHRLRALWSVANQDAATFNAAADAHLRRRQYVEAHNWYRRAARIAPQQDAALIFRAGIASVSATNQLPHDIDVESLGVTVVNRAATVPAAELRWLLDTPMAQDGDALGLHPGPDPNIGMLWWGGTALTIVDVVEGGRFRIGVAAQHVAPAPIELELVEGAQTIATRSLDRADGSWEQITVEHELKPGLHVLGVRFANDSYVAGADRNAVIGDLHMERVD